MTEDPPSLKLRRAGGARLNDELRTFNVEHQMRIGRRDQVESQNRII